MNGCMSCVFFFKQKTAYEMRISDWSSDVCSSDLVARRSDHQPVRMRERGRHRRRDRVAHGAARRPGEANLEVELQEAHWPAGEVAGIHLHDAAIAPTKVHLQHAGAVGDGAGIVWVRQTDDVILAAPRRPPDPGAAVQPGPN